MDKAKKTVATPGTYLAFRVGAEDYGLGILRVQEVLGMTDITRVPQMTDAIRGVINLRGRVIPIYDLRVAFNAPPEDTDMTCVVIGQVNYSDREITIGFISDEIVGVIDIGESELGAVPEFGKGREADFLTGMATTPYGVVMLLDIDKLMAEDDVAAAESVA